MRTFLIVALLSSACAAGPFDGLGVLTRKQATAPTPGGGGHPSDVVPGSGATGPLTEQVAPEFAPTPHEAIQFALAMYRGMRPEHTFVDIGCGDGRVLIAAVRKWNCKGLGIEIDQKQAALARRCVEAAGLSHKIEIVEGDATSPQILARIKKANAGFAFLYPETLQAITEAIESIPAFVSYQHPVAGLKETRTLKYGKFYSKDPRHDLPEVVNEQVKINPPPELKVVATAPYADWGGRRYYSEYNPGCNCAMCQSIRGQLAIQRTVTVEQHAAVPTLNVEPAGRWWWGCLNGQCGWHWVQ